MTIEEIYQLAIKMGIEADPRGKGGVQKALERRKKEYRDGENKFRKKSIHSKAYDREKRQNIVYEFFKFKKCSDDCCFESIGFRNRQTTN